MNLIYYETLSCNLKKKCSYSSFKKKYHFKIQILLVHTFQFISEYTKMYISITIIPNIMY